MKTGFCECRGERDTEWCDFRHFEMIEVLGLNESSWLKSEIQKPSKNKLFILLVKSCEMESMYLNIITKLHLLTELRLEVFLQCFSSFHTFTTSFLAYNFS